MKNHALAEKLEEDFANSDMNEADTRHQIIDRLLHEVLGWPHTSVACEQYAHPGYADYVLSDASGRAVLLIEAKREGSYFALPSDTTADPSARRNIRLRTLATEKNIESAATQAAGYCPKIGCEHACITNGHEFIIFRTFIRGRSYFDEPAIVIPSLRYFSKRFTDAVNLLGYPAVTSGRSIRKAFGALSDRARELHYAKTAIAHYDAPVSKNQHARFLDPIARAYFGEIKTTDKRMMEKCFVFARGTEDVQAGIMTRLSDRLTPFLEADGGTEISDVRKGGKLTDRIAQSIQKQRSGDVVILYGGKGSGKSTFLRRLFYHDPPTVFEIHAFPIIVDCLQVPQEREALTEHVWETLVASLDQDGLMSGPIEKLVELFEDRFAIARNQDLAGYEIGSPEYITRRNELVARWKLDTRYVCQRLRDYWNRLGKGLILALDNTDHMPPLLQDHCFLLAQNLARELSCVVIISMREERYCRARTAGVLDAYQNSGFHLAAPRLEDLFLKRLNLAINDLARKNAAQRLDGVVPTDAPFDALKRFFVICRKQFRTKDNALRRFLRDCSRDNMRIALTFFGQFISSGYTNVEEMVAQKSWTVLDHQVIKPMMVPERFNYDEDKSLIPNVFQCRTSTGSHLTTLRLLKFLRSNISATAEELGFWPVDVLLDQFESKYGAREDCEASLDVMLEHAVIEANNRLDRYSVAKSSASGEGHIYADAVRLTAFGRYMLDYLCSAFTYIEMVSLDTGISDDSLFHEFCDAAARERGFGIAADKRARLDSRIARAERFVAYLEKEEAEECDRLMLGEDERLVPPLKTKLDSDLRRVRQSAKRNV